MDVNSDNTFVKYVNGLGIDDKIRMQSGTNVSYFVQDHLGSTNALTDAGGNTVISASYYSNDAGIEFDLAGNVIVTGDKTFQIIKNCL